MLPGTGRALKLAATIVALSATALVPTATFTPPAPDTAWVIWREGPGTSGRGPDQQHYVICIPATDPVDGPLREVLVDPSDAYPVPDPVTGEHRYSEGRPCPNGQPRQNGGG